MIFTQKISTVKIFHIIMTPLLWNEAKDRKKYWCKNNPAPLHFSALSLISVETTVTIGIAMWIFLLTVRAFIFGTSLQFCCFYSKQFWKTTPLHIVHITKTDQKAEIYCSLEKVLEISEQNLTDKNFMNDCYWWCWCSRKITDKLPWL